MATSVPLPYEKRSAGLSTAWAQGAMSWLPLLGPVALSLFLHIWGLTRAGYGNTYYAAAVRSMTVSWKNFFFGSLDPGGFITVDKPPVFLWFDAISARIFGYSSLSILMPSAIAGAASVALVWLIVKRYFGTVPATLAALVLALTPISVAVNRLNLPEPFFILMLVGAAYAVLRSLESDRWWAWTALAGVLVGLAFNTKMLAGWIPGPALALAIVVGVAAPWRTIWREWLLRLSILGLVTLAVSASWMLVVDAWPASDRPYIGGSTDNTVSDLVLGYNGLGRVEGTDQGFGNRGGGGAPGGADGNFQRPTADGAGTTQQPPLDGQRGTFPGNGAVPTTPGSTQMPGADGTTQQRDGINGAPGGPGGAGAQGAGGIIAGRPGIWRMFDAANGSQIAWFLPFALLGGVLALWRWRTDPVRRGAVVLGLGWVALFAGVFSHAEGIYHSYYTSAIAPGVAILVGAGALAMTDLVRRNALWLAAVVGVAAVTLYTQLVVAGRYDNYYDWVQPIAIVAVGAGIVLVAASVLTKRPLLMAGMAIVVAGFLLIPGAWSISEASQASLNATLPQAGPRSGAAGRTFGSDAFDDGSNTLAAWLQARQDPNATWDLVVSSAQTASTLIAENGLSVMALGGFSGGDPTISADQFAELVANGEVRYVLTTGGMGPGGGGFGNRDGGATPDGRTQPGTTVPGIPDGGATIPGANSAPPTGAPAPGGAATTNSTLGANAVFTAVRAACTPVTDTTLPTQYQTGIYDCAGKAEALAAY